MAHLDNTIIDLSIILITAGIATILFKWLKQPVVLGYIVAGFIAGPHVTFLPTVTEMANVEVWAEIGVIFLLFALGLEFSFKRLMEVGGTASLATLINLGSMIIIGYIAGRFLGWTQMDSIFLGGMLSMSSTTIIIKAFNDMGLQKQKFAGIVFGMLIVEDLAAIIMMVLLSTIAVSKHIESTEVFNVLLRLVFFVLVWFVGGIYLIPTLLKKLKKYLNDETLLILSVGLCLGMVLFAYKVGFSAALGAFIMGSILAETVRSKQIEHLMEPIKNLFGAVFFVSVGMMIDPGIIKEYAGIILILTIIVLVGRIIFATLGVLASGEGLKVSLQSGFSLAQIGEFSFIIATLGMSLGVISMRLYPIIVSVSVITTFTTPYCIRLSGPFYNWLEKRIPVTWTRLMTGYASSHYKTVNRENDWNKLLKSVLRIMSIYFALSLAVIYLCDQFVTPFVLEYFPGLPGRITEAVLTILFIAPFLRSLMMKKNRSREFRKLWGDSHFNRGLLISLIAFRIILCVILVLMILINLFPEYTLAMVIVSMAVVTLIIFFQGFKKQSILMERRFLSNLNYKQFQAEREAAIPAPVAQHLRNMDVHVEEIEVLPDSPKIGKTLRELNFRNTTGVSIVTILRGNKKINIPDAQERLYPYDRIVVAGSDADIQRLLASIEERKSNRENQEEPKYHVSISQYVVRAGSPLIGRSIIESNLQEKTECMIVGIERDGEGVVNLSPQFIFEKGDTLLLAGEKVKLNSFEKNIGEKND